MPAPPTDPVSGTVPPGSEPAAAGRPARDPSWLVLAAVSGVLAAWLVAADAGHSDVAGSADVAPPAASEPAPDVLAAPPAPPPADPTATDPAAPAPASVVDLGWAEEQARRTSVPVRALLAYGGAELAMDREAPGCRLSWVLLAAIGLVESGHGTHGGSAIGPDGVARPAIHGPDLDGGAFARVDDTDGGAVDGDAEIDRAVGPLQFIPSTWARWGADGDGDGAADPQQIDDAALAASRYLCVHGDLGDPVGLRAAIGAYNPAPSYLVAVEAAMVRYAGLSRG